MSAQFGKCNFEGRPVDPADLDRVRSILAPYGPDGEGRYREHKLGILYCALHTTEESHREIQPHVTVSGSVLTWDGRLDNREELISLLSNEVVKISTDLEIVASAYERWGTDLFAKLLGDWALSIWNSKDQSLLLAKDFLGARPLFYRIEKDEVTWCTILDPLVLLAGRPFMPEQEYLAGWLSFFPAPHLTPYAGIHAVPPASFVSLKRDGNSVVRYWDFNPCKKIVYPKDAQYEEHFRDAFAESVRRRLRSDSPVLAELSGGMDSSSIVCMADALSAQQRIATPGLDTVSYFSDSEPNWNEQPFFDCVERKRGRVGYHIDVSSQEPLNLDFETDDFAATPNSRARHLTQAASEFASCITSNRNRVLLSGIGGDEVAGGLPTPLPEIEDAIARARFLSLPHQLKLWALSKRTPWVYLLFEAVRGFLPSALVGVPGFMRPPAWLHRSFLQRQRHALSGYPSRIKLFGPRPSFQENLSILDALRRQLGCDSLPSEPAYEKRYPYLDRNLLEFIYACPREQLVRPSQRRSLMRRALAGIVPEELLARRRKAYVVRAPLLALAAAESRLCEMSGTMVTTSLHLIDPGAFSGAVREACQGQTVAIVPLLRLLQLERWLRGAQRNGIITGGSIDGASHSAMLSRGVLEEGTTQSEIRPASS